MASAKDRTPRKARAKQRRIQPAVSWLLRWRLIALPIAGAIGLAALLGLSTTYSPSAPSTLLLSIFVPTALGIFVLPLLRVVFAMRFESGPKLLDLPRKSHAFITAALICAPLLFFQTLINYNHVSSHAARDAAMADALSDIAIASADRSIDETLQVNPALTGEAREDAIAAWGVPIIERENARRLADQSRVAEARRRFAALLGKEATTDEKAQLLLDLETVEERLGYSSPPKASDDGHSVRVTMDRRISVPGLYLCENLDDLRQTANAAIALRPWGGATQTKGQAEPCGSADLGRSTSAVAFTGFVGLLSFLGFALASAITLRTARLSQSSGMVAGLGVALLFPLFFALLDFTKVTLTGQGDDISVVIGSVGQSTIYAILSSFALAAISGMRKDGWAGHFVRLGLVSLPLVLVIALVLAARLIAAFGVSQGALHQLALAAPFVFSLFAWLGWEILDRIMLRLNCAPVHTTVARRQFKESETHTMTLAERTRAAGPLISAAVAIALTGRTPVERPRRVRVEPPSRIDLAALSNWLLRRHAATGIAITLCGLAVAVGLIAEPIWKTRYATLLDWSWNAIFSWLALVALGIVAQRTLSTLRFESGPRQLDLPNKFVTFALVTALIAPPFLLQSASTAIAIQKAPQDEEVYQSVAAVIAAAEPFRQTKLTFISYSADEMRNPAAMRARFETVRKDALAQLTPARTILASRIADVQRAFRTDPTAVQQSAEYLDDLDGRIAMLRAATPEPMDGGYQTILRYEDLCSSVSHVVDSSDGRLCSRYANAREHLSIRAAFAPWAIPRHLPQAENFSDTLPGARAGFIGLLGLIAFGFIAAATLRVCRLSEMPALYIFAGLVSALAANQALAEIASGALSIDRTPYSSVWIGLGIFVLAAAGFIGPLRRETWGGYCIRLVAIFFPALSTFLLATQAGVAPQILITVAPVAMLVVGWIVWELLDRWIVYANCRPNRVARGGTV